MSIFIKSCLAKVPVRFAVSLFGSILMLCNLSGCAGAKDLRPLSELDEAQQGATKGYVVKPGDLLNVQVWGEQRLSGELYVRDDGKITLSLINDVEAAGKSLGELSQLIEKKLEDFVSGAQVTISVNQQAPIRYFLSGSFIKPGEYTSVKAINFVQAIATGNGFAPFANEGSVMLIRRASNNSELRYKLDYNSVVNGNEPNPTLQDGDVLAVK